MGPTGSTTSSALIPFASGIIVPVSITSASPVIIAFGANRVVAPATTYFTVMISQYAFSIHVPAFFLHDLQCSVDAQYIVHTVLAPLTYTFTLIKYARVNNSHGIQFADPYLDTLLVVTANFPNKPGPTFSVTKVLSACGHSIGYIPVA